MPEKRLKLKFAPATAKRWPDFETLFGPRGACGGCWCMAWRQTSTEYATNKGPRNKRAMKRIIASDQVPGILAYNADGEPVGWCAVAPRETYSRLERSRSLKPIDDAPVWSVVCFFIAKEYRQQGVSVQLLEEAINFVRKRGGRIVEGYPYEPAGKKWPDAFAWTGTVAAFKQAGFSEAARHTPSRPIMRYYL